MKHLVIPTTKAKTFLDTIFQLLIKGSVDEAMDQLMFRLWWQRHSSDRQSWLEFTHTVCRQHQLFDLLQQSPFTERAFSKPRGYAGDAVMMDMIYHNDSHGQYVEPLGKRIYQWEYRTPGCYSVRERKHIATAAIDAIARNQEAARVFSLACGHLREAQQSSAIKEGRLAELVAYDQDEKSLDIVSSQFPKQVVRPLAGSVTALLRDKQSIGQFDLIYSCGLFDYLNDRTAGALLQKLAAMLRPRGRIIIANFARNLYNIGYMEAFMDWHLIYRDEQEMLQIVASLSSDIVSEYRTFRDSRKNLVFLEVIGR